MEDYSLRVRQMDVLDTECETTLRTLEEKVEEAQQKRQLHCSELISLMKRSSSIRQHLEAVIIGQHNPLWQQKKQRALIYFDDDKQLDEVVSFLFDIVSATPRATELHDPVAFTFDVLLPEVTIHSLVQRNSLQISEALQIFERGPQLEQCELDLIGRDILRHIGEEARGRVANYERKMKRALQSKEFIKML